MNGMVKVKDVLPLVKWNDVRLVLGKEDEICLLRKDFIAETLSDKILGMMVTGIENDEAILDTVNIYDKSTNSITAGVILAELNL